ncbi:hypothetical protein [Leisingera sp. M523]|uniref:hypothetical protein n=1 Tax=Leisingera sp. M523 TaxID=2867013 RepID=UPI0021A91370|nr:hypothetical protein [Leisingera sp. M523]UWQ30247.1 hypothetical protein K3557_06840 [Leisingera sp. M523]
MQQDATQRLYEQVQMFNAFAIEAAHMLIRMLFLANGIAALAVLTMIDVGAAGAYQAFSSGVIFALAAAAATYLTHYLCASTVNAALEGKDYRMRLRGKAVGHLLAVIFSLLSAGMLFHGIQSFGTE